MADSCCTNGGQAMLLACSGASNVGQLTNQACVELTQEGFGKMFCLAGVGGRLQGFIQAVKDAPELVVLDGCEKGCAKAIIQEAGLPLRGYVVLTQQGIAKNKDLNLKREQVDQVKDLVRGARSPLRMAAPGGAYGCRG
ncbi:MAG: putative zinc-binding protein [Desulfarculaceae bacterium]|nr:putative zinc-binding protein [Desulfarculaceae bacterium]MCF8046237.1 putative zinc-binding protein [Desulfarculaceae bacterium]MCF8098582.1 putative zinc-binding protein [Desulfarculaceae bacterium]MCF8120980.1 putative zinc-binding protein [Desulfarculaceae bacterium]